MFALAGCSSPSELQQLMAVQGFITASPVDLTQTLAISKFRSCAGHEYDGTSTPGVRETDRSMKHYLQPQAEYLGTNNQFKIFAPMTGTIDYLFPPEIIAGQSGTDRGGAIWMNVPGTAATEDQYTVYATVQIGHLYVLHSIHQGDHVDAGDLIGYGAFDNNGNGIDLVVRSEAGSQEYLFSFIESMSPALKQTLAGYGITTTNSIVTKTYRDAHPCGFPPGGDAAGTLTNEVTDFVYLCSGVGCSATCDIDGVTYTANEQNPNQLCQSCEPATSATTWTNASDGSGCGVQQLCLQGQCQSECVINGIAYQSGVPNPSSTCQLCLPDLSPTGWSNQPDGNGCNGGICLSGACSPSCAIDGSLYAQGAPNPTDDCQRCVPSTSNNSWTAGADGTSCDGGVCMGGSCGN